MNLVLENLREPDMFRIETEEETVNFYHFSVFDRDTGETDSMSLSISREEYDRGLTELAKGSCRLLGCSRWRNTMISP